MSENRTVSVRLVAEVQGYVAGMRQAAGVTKMVAVEANKAAATHQQASREIGRSASIAGVAVLALGAVALKSFATFDKAMSGVQAATHETARNMDLLRSAAIKAGADTAFSANEAADAETELAKAGVGVRDILGGGLRGALDLAAAGQIAVGDAASIAATAMTQFKLSGEQIPHIADLLAAGAGKAQGNVGDMGMALKQAGLVASQFGISIEDTVGGLAAFASAGLIGSDAGTSFRTMLLRLANPADETVAQMKALGIAAYDTNGSFVGLGSLADQLQKKLGGLTQAERDQALAQIFGQDAIRGANVLYQQGAEGIQNWTDKVNDQGYATETAAIQLDNLSGDIEKFTGSLQSAFIKSGSGANSFGREVTQAATGAVNAFGELPGPVQQGTVAFTALSGATLLAIGAFGTMAPKIATTRASLEELGVAGQFASKSIGALGKAGVVGIALISVGEALSFVSGKITELTGNAPPAVDALTASLVKFAESGHLAGAAMDDVGGHSSKLIEDLNELGSARGQIDKWAGNTSFGLFNRSFDEASARVDQLDKALASLVSSGHGDVAQQIFQDLIEQVRAGGGDVEEFKTRLNDYADANRNAATDAKLNAQATGEANSSAASFSTTLEGGLTPAAEDAAAAIKSYSDELQSMVEIDAFTSAAELTKQFKELHQSLKDGGKVTADEKIQLGSFARQVKQTSEAVFEQTGSQQKANDKMAAGAKHFRKLAEDAGYSAKEAKHLADELLAIPNRTDVNIVEHGAQDALNKILALRAQSKIPISVTVTTFNKIGANPKLQARGGLMSGPGTETSDSIPTMLSTGEYVVRASAVKHYGAGFFDRANAMHLASGGQVRRTAANTAEAVAGILGGTPVHDSLADIEKAIQAVERLNQAYQDQQQLRGMNAKERRKFMAEQQIAADTERLEARKTIATNRESWVFDHMSAADQLVNLDKRIKATRKYSDEWIDLSKQRESLLEDEAAAEREAAKAAQEHADALLANRAAWQFDHLSAQQQIADLDARIAAEEMYSDQWLSDMRQREQIVQQVAQVEAQAAEEARQAAEQRVKDAVQAVADAKRVRDEYAKSISQSLTSSGGISFDVDNAEVARLTEALKQAQKFGTTADVVAARDTLASAQSGTITGSGIARTMAARLEQAKQFVTDMRTLKASGLNSASLQEILGMGPEGGAAYARALVEGGVGNLSAINETQAGLQSLANEFGAETASWFHQAGVDSAQGFYDGLIANDAGARAAAAQLADWIVDALKSELEIASPSKRMAREVGRHLPTGVIAGAKQSQPELRRYLEQMVQIPAMPRYSSAQASMGTSGSQMRGGPQFNYTLHAAPSTPTETQLLQMTAQSLALLNI